MSLQFCDSRRRRRLSWWLRRARRFVCKIAYDPFPARRRRETQMAGKFHQAPVWDRSAHQTSQLQSQYVESFLALYSFVKRNYAKVEREQDLLSLWVRFKYHKWWRICFAVRYHHCKKLWLSLLSLFCIFLKRFAYPCRLSLIPRFAGTVPELCMTSSFGHGLSIYAIEPFANLAHQPWRFPDNLGNFA